jgi:hypothetical protein
MCSSTPERGETSDPLRSRDLLRGLDVDRRPEGVSVHTQVPGERGAVTGRWCRRDRSTSTAQATARVVSLDRGVVRSWVSDQCSPRTSAPLSARSAFAPPEQHRPTESGGVVPRWDQHAGPASPDRDDMDAVDTEDVIGPSAPGHAGPDRLGSGLAETANEGLSERPDRVGFADRSMAAERTHGQRDSDTAMLAVTEGALRFGALSREMDGGTWYYDRSRERGSLPRGSTPTCLLSAPGFGVLCSGARSAPRRRG